MKKILHESFNDKKTDLDLFMSHNTVVQPHFHRCYEIIYVTDGILECTIGNETLRASKDDILFIHKYYSHSYAVVEDYTKFVLLIPYNFYNDFEKTLGQNTLPSLLSDKQFNCALLPLLRDLYSDWAALSSLSKKGYVNIILGKLISHYPHVDVKKNANMELLVKILDYIDENYDKPLSLDSLSSVFGYNKYYFSKLFNRYIGENISNYINIVRLQQMMNKAKKMDNANISALAYECGFDSLSTFYRCFSKVYGVNPKEAIKNNK